MSIIGGSSMVILKIFSRSMSKIDISDIITEEVICICFHNKPEKNVA